MYKVYVQTDKASHLYAQFAVEKKANYSASNRYRMHQCRVDVIVTDETGNITFKREAKYK